MSQLHDCKKALNVDGLVDTHGIEHLFKGLLLQSGFWKRRIFGKSSESHKILQFSDFRVYFYLIEIHSMTVFGLLGRQELPVATRQTLLSYNKMYLEMLHSPTDNTGLNWHNKKGNTSNSQSVWAQKF